MREGSTWSKYDFTKIPFDKLVRSGQRSLLYRDLFCVSWLLGRFCNYRCSYCWPYASSQTKDHRPTSLLLSTMTEIKRQARERGFNSFHFSFSGGEPTIHPGYLDLLEFYAQDNSNSNYQSAHMTSNLSQNLKWFEKYVHVTRKLNRVSVTASYHSEFAKKDAFKEKLLFLQTQDIQITINMVMVPERFSALWELALEFHEAGINVTLKPQSNEKATEVVSGYTEEQLRTLQNGMPQRDYTAQKSSSEKKSMRRNKGKVDPLPRYPADKSHSTFEVPPLMQVEFMDQDGNMWFMDQAERFNAFGFNNFYDWECSAGFRSIIIREPDGNIKRSYSCSDEPLGQIETGFQLFDTPKRCCTKTCVSSADSKIPKRKPGVKAPLWPGDVTFNNGLDV